MRDTWFIENTRDGEHQFVNGKETTVEMFISKKIKKELKKALDAGYTCANIGIKKDGNSLCAFINVVLQKTSTFTEQDCVKIKATRLKDIPVLEL